MKKVMLFVLASLVTACHSGFSVNQFADLTPVGSPPSFQDPYLIVDRAQIIIEGNATTGEVAIKRVPLMYSLIMPAALAYSGSTPPSATISAITYNNPATTVGFTLNVASVVAGSMTGDILSFGNFSMSGLNDNNLKVCPVAGEANNGTVKCNKAKIRVYSTTGDSNGVFNNTTDGYNIPLLVAGIPVGVGVANAAYVQTLTIPASKNRLRSSDFTSAMANYPVTVDFDNGGKGSYTASLIVEYVLIKE